MSGYEEEHSIPRTTTTSTSTTQPRRPDLSSFFTALDLTNTTNTQNPHAEPQPSNVSAAFRMLANALQVMGGETEGVAIEHGFPARGQDGGGGQNQLLEGMIETLMMGAERPPSQVEGMSDSWFDELDRIPKTSLKPDQTCPICSLPFLDDKYPLVVRLPCHKDHIFDLDCIRPWLKLKTTCPLDRMDLKPKKKEVPPPSKAEDEEEEYDDMYA